MKKIIVFCLIFNTQFAFCLTQELSKLNSMLNNISLKLDNFLRPVQQQTMSPITRILGRLNESQEIQQRLNFIDDTNQLKKNDKIPLKNYACLRIMTYNIHAWKDPLNKANINKIQDVIRKVNPDILIMQEVTELKKTTKPFLKLDYSHITVCNASAGTYFFGNLIASKKKCASSIECFKAQHAEEKRCYIQININLDGHSITIFGIHLEVKDQNIRQQQLAEILNKQKDFKNVIIAGDFNSSHPNIPSYTNSFDALGWDNPKFTNWYGNTIDYIFVPNDPAHRDFQIVGSYIYYDPASDHIPVIMDIRPIKK